MMSIWAMYLLNVHTYIRSFTIVIEGIRKHKFRLTEYAKFMNVTTIENSLILKLNLGMRFMNLRTPQ